MNNSNNYQGAPVYFHHPQYATSHDPNVLKEANQNAVATHHQVLRDKIIMASNETLQIRGIPKGKKIILRSESAKPQRPSVDQESLKFQNEGKSPYNALSALTSIIKYMPSKENLPNNMISGPTINNNSQQNRRLSLNLEEKKPIPDRHSLGINYPNKKADLRESSLFKDDVLEEFSSNPINSSILNAKKDTALSKQENTQNSLLSTTNKFLSSEKQPFLAKKLIELSQENENLRKLVQEKDVMLSNRQNNRDEGIKFIF